MSRKRSNLETVEGVSIWRRAGAGTRVRYRVSYRDPATSGRKTETVSADRDLTVEYAKEIASRQVRTRKGLTDPVRDRYAAEDQRPIEEHLFDWATSMKAAGRDAKHRGQLYDYARAVLLGNESERRDWADRKKRRRGERRSHEPVALKPLGIRRVSQIIASKVQEQIGRVKARRSAGTATRYLDAVNGFLNWGAKDHRWERNPCQHLPRFSAEEDRRVTRRAIEADDFGRLIDTTEAPDSPRVGGLTGKERGRLYRFTVASGFRRKEIRAATVSDLATEPTPGVYSRAKVSKNKKRQFVPLPESLVRELIEATANAKPDAKLLKCPANTARMLRVDLKRAGIPYKTAAGTFDFHAVRHTTATLLISAGITNIKAIQKHMRHSRASMTTDTYGHLLESDQAATAKALPDFSEAGRSVRARRRNKGNVLPSTSANGTRDGAGILDIPQDSEWSDGESNPDLLNAIQPSNPRGSSRQPAEAPTACDASAEPSENSRAAPAVAQGDLSRVTRASRLARAEGRTLTARSVSAKIARATRELMKGGAAC